MKKLLSILLSALLLLSVFSSITAFAFDGTFYFDKEAQEIVVDGKNELELKRIYDDLIDDTQWIGLNINDGVTEIGEDIMAGCDKLTYVKIPKSVKRIKKGAFSDCDNLKTIYFAGTKSQWEKIRIEEVGNEDLLDADVEYGEKDVVNNIPLYIILGVVVVASLGLTLASTRKARKK